MLLQKGIHPSVISDSYKIAMEKAVDVLDDMAVELDLTDTDSLVKAASTSLASKMVSQHA